MTIKHTDLDDQLLAYIIKRVLSPESLEYATEVFLRRIRHDLAEAERQASRNQSDGPKLKQQLLKLQTEARNIGDAIAVQGHHRSPTLLTRLTQVEAEVEAIQDRFNNPAFKMPNISEDEIRKFVVACAGEFEQAEGIAAADEDRLGVS